MKRKQPGLRHQVASLPLRRSADGSVEICLITSRETRRWLIPKGWPMKGLAAWHAAAREAREEAGLLGDIDKTPIGTYRYWKRLKFGWELVEVVVFVLSVTRMLSNWREKGQRTNCWVSLEEAVERVQEPELQDVIGQMLGRESFLLAGRLQR
ncbi:NUDIX hydrolase [Bosea sp. RCC_152_1]|uniref:NUDIX hydrolase n=1 Tax=Bosea sp. RCC_152_1 TaxID=3239228 RepID=UPI0035253D87